MESKYLENNKAALDMGLSVCKPPQNPFEVA